MIYAILEKLACKHEWTEGGRADKKSTFTGNTIQVQALYICSKCGKMKKVTYE